jgi:hypothetical protein
LQAKTQTLKMTIVSGLRIIDSNAQTGITWWNWTSREKNKTVKEALDNDFTNKFNKWIYETKIKQ